MSKQPAKFAAATAVYLGLAIYLYWPYVRYFAPMQYILLVNCPLAALGAFALSRRWVYHFWGRSLAGALYGFGPFVLGLARYHPTAGLLAAAVPWFFCPAALAARPGRKWLQALLSAVPFLAVGLLFEALAYLRLFPVPLQNRLTPAELTGLAVPLALAQRNLDTIGFYHIPLAALIIGISLLFAGRRFGIMSIFVGGTALAFCPPVLNISPLIWLTVPVLVCSILAGVGLQSLLSAGHADRKWVLSAAFVLAVLALVTILAARGYLHIGPLIEPTDLTILLQSSKLYLVGSIAVTIIYFLASIRLRMYSLRLAILGSAMAVDIFFGAGFIIDRMF